MENQTGVHRCYRGPTCHCWHSPRALNSAAATAALLGFVGLVLALADVTGPGVRQTDADSQAIVGVYKRLQERNKVGAIPTSTWEALRIRNYSSKNKWYWIDATYMGSLAYMASGDSKLYDTADAQLQLAISHLWDPEDHLFYRDAKSKRKWGRGNGWAALAMAEMAARHAPFVTTYGPHLVALLNRVIALQHSNGAWSSDLKETADPGESSATAAFAASIQQWINLNVQSVQYNQTAYSIAATKARAWLQSDSPAEIMNKCQPKGRAPSLKTKPSQFCAGLIMMALCT